MVFARQVTRGGMTEDELDVALDERNRELTQVRGKIAQAKAPAQSDPLADMDTADVAGWLERQPLARQRAIVGGVYAITLLPSAGRGGRKFDTSLIQLRRRTAQLQQAA